MNVGDVKGLILDEAVRNASWSVDAPLVR